MIIIVVDEALARPARRVGAAGRLLRREAPGRGLRHNTLYYNMSKL